MKLNSREKNIWKILAVFACLLAVLFTVSSVSPIRAEKTTAVAQNVTTYMTMESEDLEWNGSMRVSSGNGQIYGNGHFIDSLSKPVMTVLKFPAIAEVKFNTTIRKQYTEGNATLRFRIVHEHASSGLNEVIFPKDGGWLDLNAQQVNSEGTGYENYSITDFYVGVRAGDKLKLIVENTNNGSWCTAVIDGGISFIYDGGLVSGLNFGYANASVSYATSDTATDAIPAALQAYYGAGAVKSDVISYQYIKSYT